MAVAGNSYKLLLEAQLDPAKIQAQINSLSNKSVLNIKMNFAQGDMAKFESELEKVRAKASSIGKVTLFGDEKGGVNRIAKATIEYKDALGNVVQEYIQINKQASITQKYTEDLAKDEKEINNIIQKRASLNAKQADEMERAAHQADLFLAKSENLAKTKSVQATIGKAQEIKVAVSEGDINKVRTLNKEFATLKASLQTGRTGLDSWSEGMRNSIKQTLEYATSIGLVYGALNQLRQGVQYLTELDKEMTSIQLVTGETDDEIVKLSLGYNNLAKSLGATTLEVAKGSLEWRRQGKTVEETSELMEATMMMSKLANMESAQATEYLTSILNGFKLEAKDAEDVISKLVALDNAFATSTGEIASAMQRSSVSAQQAGVSMEELASMITVVSDVSRRAPESIGESFKTMFARYQDILAGQVDEDGQGINNVGKALERIGINIRDAEGGFKDFSDVLDELYPKWGQLSEVEQANITKALAGVRQRESLLVLLENETKYRKALTETMNAEGLASERYATYLDSVEAAQNRVTASWESLIMSTATSDMVKNFYDGAAGALDFVNALGGIPTILKIVIPLVVLFNAELIKTKILATGDVISGLVSGLKMLIPSLMGTTAAAQGTTASLMAANVAALPFVLTVGAIAAALVYATAKTIEFKEAQDEIRESYQNSQKDIESAVNSYDEYVFVAKKAAEAAGYMVDEQGRAYAEGYHGAKVYVEGIDLLTEAEWNAKYAGQALTEQIQGEKELYEETAETVASLSDSYVGFADTLKLLSGELDTINGLIEKSKEGTLDFSDVTKIPEEYLDALVVEGDRLKLNIDLIKQKQLAEAEMAYQSILAAQQQGEATAQQVEVVRFMYNQLLAESQNTFGQFEQTAWQYDELLWSLANDADSAGASIVGMEGQALTSAQSIYDYISSGDQAFNDFVRQVAALTGQSVEQVMNQINGMIQTTANNAAALINYLGSASLGVDSGFNRAPSAPSAPPSLFPGGGFTPPSYPSGGGGGGSGGSGGGSGEEERERENEERERERELEEELRKIEEEINKSRNEAILALEEQLKNYDKIIDARKKILQTLADERKYKQDVSDKNKEILRVQNELATLKRDNSEEANARRLQLEEELKELKRDLKNIHYEEKQEDKEDALDKERAKFEEKINSVINAIKAIDATSLDDFTKKLAEILSSMGKVPKFHDGAKAGVVGSSGGIVKKNEMFAKLLAGEVVVNSPQISKFFSNTLPAIAESSSANSGGDINLDMPINVMGSLDKSVIPDINKIAEKVLSKIQGAMNNRGYNRRADAFQI